jgi:hypothetical protein
MRSVSFFPLILIAIVSWAVPCEAQGQAFGIGARLSMVRADTDGAIEPDSARFTGGQVRLRLSSRTALEASLDIRSHSDELLDERVKEYPMQVSLLLYPVRSVFSPYLLGGPGWYTTKVEPRVPVEGIESVTTRRFGWHAGFGAELRLGNHAGLHGDYRYTFLRFGDDDDELDAAPRASPGDAIFGSLLPSSGGSMWTVGLTIYF